MFTPETVIQNRYRIVRHLETAQGEVYEAYDDSQQQAVTVQVWATPDASALERIQHAATARSKSIHPSLPAIVAHFAEGAQYILVTEWVQGTPLAEHLASQGSPFTPAQVLSWAEQLLDALMVLHRQTPTLAHGDVRAETLSESAEGNLKLLGTQLYSIGGTHAPTEDEDVYDTCAALYYLLTGVKPPAMAGRTERGFLPSADTLNPLVPTALGSLLAQGLSENEDDRFNSAYALQNALRRVQTQLNETPTVIAPPPPRTVPSLAAKLQQRQAPPSGSVSLPLDTGVLPVSSRTDGGVAGGATVFPFLQPDVTALTDGGNAIEAESDTLQASVQPSGFEPQPIPVDSLFTNPTPNDAPNPAPDPFKLTLGATEPTFDAETGTPYTESSAEPPPAYEPPPAAPPPPPANKNRIWFALGIGCIGAILCICCGLIGVVAAQWDSIVDEIEAADITIPEPDATPDADTNGDNPFVSNDNTEDSSDSSDLNDSNSENNDGITVSVFDIKVGDCYQDPEESDFVSELTLVDCDAPHDNEIYAFGLYPADEDDEFPDEETLDEFTDEYCTEVFEEYVGIAYDDSIYYVTYLQPTEESWNDGDREVVCILYDQDGPIEGSKKDSQE